MKKNRLLLLVRNFMFLVFLILSINIVIINGFRFHIRSATNLTPYIDNANVVSRKISAKRGTIFDANGNVIAKDIDRYDVIAIVDKNRPSNGEKLSYVDDVTKTAKILASVLGGEESTYYNLLNQNGIYQTELGIKGKNISIEKKEELESYDLPGIEFRKIPGRFYPLGNFAPYLIGFAQSDENSVLKGKMGLEAYLDDKLKGEDGYEIYQSDSNGYILPGMYKEEKIAKDGYNVYTTIDKSIQEILNLSIEESVKLFKAKNVWGAVVEIDSGKILAWGQYPSFDPNNTEISDYLNRGSQYLYEPGSVFKGLTYAAAMNNGNYNGEKTYDSQKYCFYANSNDDPVRTYNWDADGCVQNALDLEWGEIPIDYGLVYSSNVATATLLSDYLGSAKFFDYLTKFGLFEEVNTDGIVGEKSRYTFDHAIEKVNMTFGQGISTTMLHMLQAFTAIMGDGNMIKPYFIDRIEDPYNHKTIYQHEKEIVREVISKEVAKKMQDLMRRVVTQELGTASGYAVDNVEIIAKTGTGEIPLPTGGYDPDNTLSSVIVGFPYHKPKYMIYYAMEAKYILNQHYINTPVTDLISKVAKITSAGFDRSNIQKGEGNIKSLKMPKVAGHSLEYSKEVLKDFTNVVILGDGANVYKQYPEEGSILPSDSKIFLLTDLHRFKLPNLIGYSKKDVVNLWKLTDANFVISGSGVVSKQSLKPNSLIDNSSIIIVKLEEINKEKIIEKEVEKNE